MSLRRKCRGTKKNGKPCAAWALVGADYCSWHADAIAAGKKRQAVIAGQLKGALTKHAEAKRIAEFKAVAYKLVGTSPEEFAQFCAAQILLVEERLKHLWAAMYYKALTDSMGIGEKTVVVRFDGGTEPKAKGPKPEA